MATAVRSQARKQPHHFREIVINGRIPSATRSELVKDILKFLLFHREQIPLPYEQLKRYFDKQQNIKKGSEAVKLSNLLDAVQDLCVNLDDLFRAEVPVESLLILLGPTVATPKEIYRIEFSNQVTMEPLSRVPSTKMCSRLLHKSLVTFNPIFDLKPPSVTSLHILFQGQRSERNLWFQPKHNFKVPKRGQYFTFQILSSVGQVEGLDAGMEEAEMDCGHQLRAMDARGDISGHLQRDSPIWFAAPKPLKGVKDTVLSIPKQGEMWVQ